MKVKSIINVKNIICLAAAAALAAGFFVFDKKNIDVNDIRPKEKEPDKQLTQEEDAVEEEPEKKDNSITLSAAIPELSCSSIKFGEDTVIFADNAGEYAFIDEGSNSKWLNISDDIGRDIMFTNSDSEILMQSDGQDIESFVFDRHLIELKDGVLYYDSSPVEYTGTSFSAYRLNDEYTLECVDKGRYRLRNSDGEITDSCRIKDASGASLTVHADDDGFIATGVDDGLFYNVFKFNDDVFITSWGYVVYINGSELVPYGYNDEYVNPDSKGIGETAAIEPSKPPRNYGDVNTHNEGLSDVTKEMLGYVNEVREQYGLEKLYGLSQLDRAAEARAEELTEKFEHKRPDEKESSYATAITKEGLFWWHCGENIAKGSVDSGREIFEAWMSSEEHRANILNPKLKYMAAAFTESGGEYYWEQLFFNDTYVP